MAAARVITGATSGTNHDSIYEESGLEKLSERRNKSKLILFFKIRNGDAPQYLQKLVPNTVQERNRYNVRSSTNISLIPARTNYSNSSFFPSVVQQWNNLPLSTQSAEDLADFKKRLNRDIKPVNPLYYQGERRLTVPHARLCMGCSKLNYDQFKKRY